MENVECGMKNEDGYGDSGVGLLWLESEFP